MYLILIHFLAVLRLCLTDFVFASVKCLSKLSKLVDQCFVSVSYSLVEIGMCGKWRGDGMWNGVTLSIFCWFVHKHIYIVYGSSVCVCVVKSCHTMYVIFIQFDPCSKRRITRLQYFIKFDLLCLRVQKTNLIHSWSHRTNLSATNSLMHTLIILWIILGLSLSPKNFCADFSVATKWNTSLAKTLCATLFGMSKQII